MARAPGRRARGRRPGGAAHTRRRLADEHAPDGFASPDGGQRVVDLVRPDDGVDQPLDGQAPGVGEARIPGEVAGGDRRPVVGAQHAEAAIGEPEGVEGRPLAGRRHAHDHRRATRAQQAQRLLDGRHEPDGLEDEVGAPVRQAQDRLVGGIRIGGHDGVRLKKGITILSNNGRLKSDEINKLVIEAKEYELRDKLEKYKKQSYYEVDELCNIITENIKKDCFKLIDDDKKAIREEIDETLKWLKEKKYNEREEDEYKRVIERLKKKHSVLVMRVNTAEDNVQANIMIQENATTVKGDEADDDMKKVFEKVENEEMGIQCLNDNEKTEIKQLKNSLMELCSDIHDIISSVTCILNDDHKKELIYYIDDVLLWIHIQQNSTKGDFKMKLEEVDTTCNKIYLEYNKDIFKDISSAKDELEILCYSLQSAIDNNIFSCDEKDMIKLKTEIENTLAWLIDVQTDITDEVYKEKIIQINELCGAIYNSINETTHHI